jgi:nitroreductase
LIVDKKTRANFRALEEQVADAGGIAVLEMWQLRDAAGYAKLGVNVVKTLAVMLDEVGLGTLPVGATLPLEQYSKVRVYQQKSAVGSVVDAVMHPSGRGDDVLRRLTSDDADEILQRIREMVCGV